MLSRHSEPMQSRHTEEVMSESTIWPVVAEAKQWIQAAEDDGDLIDVLGDIRSVEAALAKLRQAHQADLDDGIGSRWQKRTPAPAKKRTYNSDLLLMKIMDARGGSLGYNLAWLLDKGIVRLTWQWRPLTKLLDLLNIEWSVRHNGTVGPGDEKDVGETKGKAYPRYDPA